MIDLLIVRRFGRRHTACVMPLPARRHKISITDEYSDVVKIRFSHDRYHYRYGLGDPKQRVFCIYFMCRPGTDDKHFDLNFDTV